MTSLDYLHIERLERENDHLREQIDLLRKSLERLAQAGEGRTHTPALGAALVDARYALQQTDGKNGR
jgi:hypothetical protein